MKLIAKIAVLGAAAVVLLGIAASLALDPALEKAVERGTSYGTGTETTLGAIDLSLFSGRLALDELSSQNPEGFRDEPFLALGKGVLDVETASLFGDRIEIPSILLEGITLNIEKRGGSTNYGAILEHLQQLSPDAAGAADEKPPAAPEPEAGPLRTLHVASFVMTDIDAALHLDIPLVAASASVHVPRVEIIDFDTRGTTREVVAKLTRALVDALLHAVVEAGGDVVPADILANLDAELGALRAALDGDTSGLVETVRQRAISEGLELLLDRD